MNKMNKTNNEAKQELKKYSFVLANGYVYTVEATSYDEAVRIVRESLNS